jgi:mannosyl-oligosaccharide alpha-1,2-mannosidase
VKFPGFPEHTSLGAFGDSFYEYLLKSWIQTSRHDAVAREMYDEAMKV